MEMERLHNLIEKTQRRAHLRDQTIEWNKSLNFLMNIKGIWNRIVD
jgi:hypothetical protein